MGARKAEMTLLENVWETILTVCLKFCQKNIVFPEQLIHVQDRLQHNLFWCFSYNAIWQTHYAFCKSRDNIHKMRYQLLDYS